MNGIRTPGVERIHAPDALPSEDELDRSLRPRRLEDFVGQDGVKSQLGVFIEAARARGEALDHVLLAGPPGLGKTSLAQIVANELGVAFVATAGPALERKGDVAATCRRSSRVRCSSSTRSTGCRGRWRRRFYPAMEDRGCRSRSAQGAGARVGHARIAASSP